MLREYKFQGFLKLDCGSLTEHKNLKIDISVYLHFTASSELTFPLKV